MLAAGVECGTKLLIPFAPSACVYNADGTTAGQECDCLLLNIEQTVTVVVGVVKSLVCFKIFTHPASR